MAEAARVGAAMTLRRDAILEAVASAAERLLLASDWRDVAQEVVARLGEASEISRAYIVQRTDGPDGSAWISSVAEWTDPRTARVSDDPALRSGSWADGGLARWAERLAEGEPVVGDVDDLPEAERRVLERHGTRSVACYPIATEAGWWGAIGFEDHRGRRDWSGPETDALRVVAGILAAAIERQRAEQELRDAERAYRAFVETIPAVTYTDVVVPGEGARLGFVSPQIEQILGYPPKRFLEEPGLWFDLIHPDDLARLRAADAFNAQDLSPFDEEYRMRAADGRWVWVHDVSTAVFADDGTVAYFQGFLEDVTARRLDQEALREAEARYRSIVEQTPAITYQEFYVDGVYDREGPVYTSPQLERILGFTPEEWVVPGFWRGRVHPDDLPAVDAESDRVIAEGATAYRQEYRMIARDGRVVWIHDESALIRDEAGTPLFWQGVMVDVTERREAEDQLRQAEERFRALVEHIPAIVYQEAITPTPGSLYLSPQVESILGYRPQEWSSPHTVGFWREHIHPEDRERVLAINEDADRTGERYVAEYRFRAADDRWVWLHDEAALVRDEAGAPLYWQGFMFDISERKQAEERLALAESRLRALVENIPAVVYVEAPDADPAKFYIGPQVEAIFGYPAHEWTWTPDFWIDRVHPDDLASALAADRRSNDTHEPYRLEYRFRRADGTYIWVRDEAVFLPGGEAEEGFWQGFLVDITAQKEAEEQLRETSERFRAIVEQNPAVIYTQEFDPNDPSYSRTTYISPRQTELLGYGLDEVLADPTLWTRQLHPEDRERVLEADIASNVEGADSFSMEYRMITKDGRIVWVNDQAKKVEIEGRPPFWQGFLVDITERKAAETRLELALEVEREATQRLRALDEMKNTFLQAVSHDLRTPLSAILGLAITLERADVTLSPEDARDLAGRIAENARRLERLVANLLDLDRLARGIVEPQLEDTDLGALVGRVIEESRLIEGERLVADLASVTIAIDASKVERIVENLLANTARHAPPDATVWVSVGPVIDGVLLVVEDDGPGVAPELRESIFQPFEQGPHAPAHSPGVGVGLALVRRFAELHGGRAWVEEREGGGASFRVFLPSVPAGTEA
jgi:PAS domain S-box-containing protein